METPEALWDAVSTAVEGADLGELLDLFAFMLADTAAQLTDYAPDREAFLEAGALYSQAYQFVCTPDSITTH